MIKLTEKPYKCSLCGEMRKLVIRYRRAYLCESCDNEVLAKRRTMRELNKIARLIIYEGA